MGLLTTVGLMSVLAGIAYTSLQPFVQKYRVKGAAVMLASTLYRARQEAIRTRLCHFYVPDGGARFRIVRDDPKAPNCQLDAGDSTVQTIDMSAQFPRVSFSAAGATQGPYGNALGGATPANLRFEPRGLVTASGGSSIFVSSGSYGPIAVTVTAAGSIRTWRLNGGSWQ